MDMYFDAVVVKVKTFLLLFRLALAILCHYKFAQNCIISFTLFLYLDELKVFVSDEKK